MTDTVDMSEWVEIDSTMIEQARFLHGRLEIVFRSNPSFRWLYEVDREIFEGLLESDSPGTYFRRHLARLPFTKELFSESE